MLCHWMQMCQWRQAWMHISTEWNSVSPALSEGSAAAGSGAGAGWGAGAGAATGAGWGAGAWATVVVVVVAGAGGAGRGAGAVVVVGATVVVVVVEATGFFMNMKVTKSFPSGARSAPIPTKLKSPSTLARCPGEFMKAVWRTDGFGPTPTFSPRTCHPVVTEPSSDEVEWKISPRATIAEVWRRAPATRSLWTESGLRP